MKTLKNFINESKANETFAVKLPDCDPYENGINVTPTWRKFEFPLAKYVVYKDMYHGGVLHFATLDDMVRNIAMFCDDFEDFNPKKDIAYASNNFKETLDWYMNKIGIDLSKVKDADDLEEAIQDMYGDKLECDSAWFFANYGEGTSEQEKNYVESSYADEWLQMNRLKIDPQKWFTDMMENYV